METQFKNVKKYRTKHKILCEIPFNSRTRYQVFVHEIAEKNHISQHFVSIKVLLATQKLKLRSL